MEEVVSIDTTLRETPPAGVSQFAIKYEDYSTIGLAKVGDFVVGADSIDYFGQPYIGEFIVGKSVVGGFKYIDLNVLTSLSSSYEDNFTSLSFTLDSVASAYTLNNITLSTTFNSSTYVYDTSGASLGFNYDTVISSYESNLLSLVTQFSSSSYLYSTETLSIGLSTISTSNVLTDLVITLDNSFVDTAYSTSDLLLSNTIPFDGSNSSSDEYLLVSLSTIFESLSKSSSDLLVSFGTSYISNSETEDDVVITLGLLKQDVSTGIESSSTFIITCVLHYDESINIVNTEDFIVTMANSFSSNALSNESDLVTIDVPIVSSSTLASENKFTLSPHNMQLWSNSYIIDKFSVGICDTSSINSNSVPLDNIYGTFNHSLFGVNITTDLEVSSSVGLSGGISNSISVCNNTNIGLLLSNGSSYSNSYSDKYNISNTVEPTGSSQHSYSSLTINGVVHSAFISDNISNSYYTCIYGIIYRSTSSSNASMSMLSAVQFDSVTHSYGELTATGKTLLVQLSRSYSVGISGRIYRALYFRALPTYSISYSSDPTLTSCVLYRQSSSTSYSAYNATVALNVLCSSVSTSSTVVVSGATGILESSSNTICYSTSNSRGLLSSSVADSHSIAVFTICTQQEGMSVSTLLIDTITAMFSSAVAISESNCLSYINGAINYNITTISNTYSAASSVVCSIHTTVVFSSSIDNVLLTIANKYNDTSSSETLYSSLSIELGAKYNKFKTASSIVFGGAQFNDDGSFDAYNSFGWYTIYQLDSNYKPLLKPADGIVLLNYAADVAYDRIFRSPVTSPRIFYSGTKL